MIDAICTQEIGQVDLPLLKHVCAPTDSHRQDAIEYAFHMGIIELRGDPMIDAQVIAMSWDDVLDAYDRYIDDQAARAEWAASLTL